MSCVNNIIRGAIRKADEPLNILTTVLDGRFQSLLAKTGHNFYIVPMYRFTWNTDLIPIPANCKVLKPNEDLSNVQYDLIICNDRYTQYEQCFKLSVMLHIPMLIVDHFSPQFMVKPEVLDQMRQTQKASMYSVISSSIKYFWGDSYRVVPYGVETQPNYSSEPKSGSLIMGDFQPQELGVVGNIARICTDLTLINNSNFAGNRDAITNLYNKKAIYINLSAQNSIPLSMLEAMSAGCAIITNDIPLLHDVFDEEDCVFCKSINDFGGAIQKLQNDNNLINKYGERSKSIINEKFPLDTAIKAWNEVLVDTADIVYTR